MDPVGPDSERPALLERLIEGCIARFDREPPAQLDGALATALVDFAVCVTASMTAGTAAVDRRSIIGRLLSGDLEAAGTVAMMAHAQDRDDLHWPTLTHPGAIIWPTVVASSDATDGAAALRAAAVGYQMTTELANILGPHHRRFWHATTTCGTVGSAAAGALAYDGDPATAATAASHAAAVSGGSIVPILQRGGASLFLRAHAVRTGLAASTSARSGLAPVVNILDHERGLLAAMGATVADQGLDEASPWTVQQLSFRPFATTGFAHAAVSASEALGRIDPTEVVRVEVAVPPSVVEMASSPMPASPEEAWWSTEDAVATCLVGGPGELDDPRHHDDPAVAELRAKTTLHGSTGVGAYGAEVTVWSSTGARSGRCHSPPGHPDNPIDISEVIAKWTRMLDGLDETAFESALAAADTARDRGLRSALAAVFAVLGTGP